MIKIVTGIDFEHYPFATECLQSMRIPEAQIHLLHVVESVLPDKSFPDVKPPHPLGILMAERTRQGYDELAEAGAKLQDSGYSLSSELRQGDPARALIEYAGELSADLIAVGSTRKGPWSSLFFGSVTKALTASAPQSILVAKTKPKSKEGITAVLAVDHSDYCNACIDRLLEWRLEGLRRVLVVSAPEQVSLNPAEGSDDFKVIREDLESEVRARNAEICERFAALGIDCEQVLMAGHPNPAIDRAMEQEAADLLILGARGHGFWDRFRLGSVSHYQVVATAHTTLVVRV